MLCILLLFFLERKLWRIEHPWIYRCIWRLGMVSFVCSLSSACAARFVCKILLEKLFKNFLFIGTISSRVGCITTIWEHGMHRSYKILGQRTDWSLGHVIHFLKGSWIDRYYIHCVTKETSYLPALVSPRDCSPLLLERIFFSRRLWTLLRRHEFHCSCDDVWILLLASSETLPEIFPCSPHHTLANHADVRGNWSLHFFLVFQAFGSLVQQWLAKSFGGCNYVWFIFIPLLRIRCEAILLRKQDERQRRKETRVNGIDIEEV